MKERLQELGQRGWGEFRGFSAGQKAVTIVAALAVIVIGVVFATWHSSTPYGPLYTNLAASDASKIVDKLSADGIKYKLAQDGTEVLVPQNQVFATRLKMSSAGLPDSDQTGYALLDKEGVTTSEFKQQIDYQRAIEGELDKTIESMSGVQSASVHLAIPQQDVFNDGSQKPTAAVLLTTDAATQLTASQVQSVVYLISSSVPNLSANDVTVTDSNGQLLAAPGDTITDAAGTDTRTQATQDYETALSAKLQSLLTPYVGAGHAVVTVNADLNFDKTTTTKNDYTYTPSTPPLSEATTSEKYTGNQAATGGTLGAGTPAATPSASTGAGSYDKETDTKDNALGTETQTTQVAPGDVSKKSIAVLIDSSVKNVNVPAITALLQSAAGINTAQGDTFSIQAMPFDTSAAKAAAASAASAAKAAAAKSAHQHLMSLVRQAALGGLLLAVLVGTWLASRRRKRPTEDEPNDPMFADDDPLDLPPVTAPEPAPISAEAMGAAVQRRTLVTLANEQPRDVASVLSGWLNDKNTDLVNDRGRIDWKVSR